MSGKAIGKTLPLGFRGNVARTPDCLIMPFPAVGSGNIPYGAAVVWDATNKGVRTVASSGDVAGDIIGFAVRRIGQPHEDAANGYYYKPGETVDVLVRGTIMVELKATTGIAARGQVYVDPTDGELTSVSTSNFAVGNTKFATGEYDANKICAVTILERNM